jgi:muramoyltetrapeptide carboxypeptidase
VSVVIPEPVRDSAGLDPQLESHTAQAKSLRIGILALGGYEADLERLQRTRNYFERHGASTVLAPASDQRHLRFAGDDAARLTALRSIVDDPLIDIVVALRGGYGLTRLLPHIDFEAIAQSIRQGKRFVGHSDFTAFHLGLLSQTGAVSYAGPLASDFGVDLAQHEMSTLTESHFWAMMNHGTDSVQFTTTAATLNVPSGLTAAGLLWGGNLTMLCSLLATPWMPQIQDGILFLEDVNEHPYRVERMLLQLHQAGVLERQRAILLGDFSNFRLHDYDNGYNLDTMLSYLREVIQVPLISGLPFGHTRDKLTLPVGGQAELSVTNGQCLLQMRASEAGVTGRGNRQA